jgi:Nucleotidyltransferase domain.
LEPLEVLESLKEWRSLIDMIRTSLTQHFEEMYVYGSVLTGRLTGSSDIDIILVCANCDVIRAKIMAYEIIEQKIGYENSLLFDVTVVQQENKNKPPHQWLLKGAQRIF